MPRLIYVATDDWFFASHFLPMAKAAVADGYDVAFAARVGDKRAEIEAAGVRVLPLGAMRGQSASPLATVRELTEVFRREKPDLVHLIALRPILWGGIAAKRAGVERRVLALTGQGFAGASRGLPARAAKAAAFAFVRRVLDGPRTFYLFENATDAAALAPHAPERRKTVGGAGIDPAEFPVREAPPLPPFRVAMVARMLWQKGVDIAVEAVRLARRENPAIELSLYGMPDRGNPRAFSEQQLRRWSELPGIAWHGHAADVAAVWAGAHLCVLPSRGGEGLPRSLLEAAACGRPMLTSDVPGCRDFVRDGLDGLVVPAGSAEALADAILILAADPARCRVMGASARERVCAGYTAVEVGRSAVAVYDRLMRAG